ncbi:hypothetical protein KY308_01715 [Candidatus Woesearchaeota archaeon]|nr:hypothetical protein [Candidatus Woesearchaeota archaeon]
MLYEKQPINEKQMHIPVEKKVWAKEFYGSNLEEAVRKCKEDNHGILYMPELVNARIKTPIIRYSDPFSGPPVLSDIWEREYTTVSLMVVGKTFLGEDIMMFIHKLPETNNAKNDGVFDFFSEEHFDTMRNIGALRGAGVFPTDLFEELVNRYKDNDGKIFVREHKKIVGRKNKVFEDIKLKNALKHPFVIPYLGGRYIAEEYVDKIAEEKATHIKLCYGYNKCSNIPLATPLKIMPWVLGQGSLNQETWILAVPKG